MAGRTNIGLMPKAELHAHLNGSISAETMRKLLSLRDGQNDEHSLLSQCVLQDMKYSNQIKSLKQCFEVFEVIHQLVDTHQALYTATVDVISEFAADNVRYLELRTTPRQLEGSLRDYMEAVIKAIDECKTKGVPILVKLLLSINRSQCLAKAENVVDLAIALKNERPDLVAGLDVSGYMLNSDITEFFPLLSKAREVGLKLTVHTAEVRNDAETISILEFKPDRIGHGTFAINDTDPFVFSLLKKSGIPVEVCLTSNVLSKTVKSYEAHHLKELKENGLPFCICTDDKGVFMTSLSEEYWISCTTFGLSIEEIWSISRKTLDYAFLSADEKAELAKVWDDWREANRI